MIMGKSAPSISAQKPGRFFDSRAAYMMFVTTTNEKAVVAARLGDELSSVTPGDRALRVFDAGMGDASVLSQLMREMHQAFTHIPWLIVGKEISLEDARLALAKLPDRFAEHPEMVFVLTNMYLREAPTLTPTTGDPVPAPIWREEALEGSTAHDLAKQISAMLPMLTKDWVVRTSPKTGNPLYVRSSVLVLYRKDREFLLRPVIPTPGDFEGVYDFIMASQPYRARSSAEKKAELVVAPLARALAPGGRLAVVHSHGNDPGLEIVRGVWPDEDPFRTGRHELLAEAKRQLDQPAEADLLFHETTDAEALFRYDLHAMPSEVPEHIGTSSILAAWNAAAYVAQIDEDRLSDAMEAGTYLEATREVVRAHGGVWFNDEAYLISRRP